MSLEEFKSAHEARFATLAPIIEAFALEHGLIFSRFFDRDPVGPCAAYFCSWQDRRPRMFIAIRAQDPWEPGPNFYVDADGMGFYHQRWNFSTAEGLGTLQSILEEAKRVLERKAADEDARRNR
jgi:hypothetical protein